MKSIIILFFIAVLFLGSSICLAQEFYSEELDISVEKTGEAHITGVFVGENIQFPLAPNELSYEIESISFEIGESVYLKVYYNEELDVELAEIMADIVAEASSEIFEVEFIKDNPEDGCFVYSSEIVPSFSDYYPSTKGFAEINVFNDLILLESRRSSTGWINSATLYYTKEDMFAGYSEHTLDILSYLGIQKLTRNSDSVFSTLDVNFYLDDFSYISSIPDFGKDYSSYPFPAYFDKKDANIYSLIFGDDFSDKNQVSISFSGTFLGDSGSGSDGDSGTPGFEFLSLLIVIAIVIFLFKKKQSM